MESSTNRSRSGNTAAVSSAPGALAMLRRFHVGDPAAAAAARDALPRVPAGVLPALLHPFRAAATVRSEFPIHVPREPLPGGALCEPIAEFLRGALERSAGAPDRARILADNLTRAERAVQDEVRGRGGRGHPRDVLVAAGDKLVTGLKLAPDASAQLSAQWQALVAAVPEDGELFALDRKTPLHLMLAAARALVPARRKAFLDLVGRLRDGLRSLLEVEHRKDPRADDGSAIGGAVGQVGASMLDPKALARVIGPHRGTARLDASRRLRIEQALGVLDDYVAADLDEPFLTVVHEPGRDPGVVDRDLRCVALHDPCAAAASLFDVEAERRAILFRAVRTARLELDGVYDPERHEMWLESLDWQGFTRDELLLMPTLVALESAAELCAERMPALSRLLLSGRPVHVLALATPGDNPAMTGADRFVFYRLELGYLGIGHREAFVQQSTAARPEHLGGGFVRALTGSRTGLHVVDTGLDRDDHAPSIGAWLHAGAAIEGRAHPLFRYDPEAGATWARRLDFAGNPQPEEDWPANEDGARFTFADYALLEPGLTASFAPIDDAIDDSALISVADALAVDPTEPAPRLPFVRGVRADGTPCRLALTRRLLVACRDRLDFWNTLQELAGVRNEHVREAVERAREEAAASAAAERTRLVADHAAELERVRDEAVGGAMAALSRSLLELGPEALDLGATVVVPRPPPVAAAPAIAEGVEPAAPDVEPEPPAAAVSEVEFEEPWIDTPLCTSCNDCRNINPVLFVYDENKQARIGDPNAGSFLQLVTAAEKCPARCIHPGLPLNRDEANLDDLVARAAPFNR